LKGAPAAFPAWFFARPESLAPHADLSRALTCLWFTTPQGEATAALPNPGPDRFPSERWDGL